MANSDTSKLYEEALQASTRAVKFDSLENHEAAAAYYYRLAADLLEKASETAPETNAKSWVEKAEQYKARAIKLDGIHDDRTKGSSQTVYDKELQKCYFFFNQGLDADEIGHSNEAVEYYTKAVEIGIGIDCDDPELKEKVKHVTLQALERAEELKGIKPKNKVDQLQDNVSNLTLKQGSTHPVKSTSSKTMHRGFSAHLKVSSAQETYTEEEKRVLMHTSDINNNKYLPFMSVDLSEQFQYTLPFSDKDGLLALAPKQKRDFVQWCRPDEICSDPKMVAGSYVDYFSIKQTVISDCSFVASLAVSALYEKRFQRPLITSIVFPRNRNNQPIYNPFGKYMIKLHLNGVSRKIIIDDFLPVGRNKQLLCSYSSNRNEFWVSLLEKAYMKVMGGYDFPGSNSSIDLHALTGWIPERVAIRTNDPTFNKNGFFDMVQNRLTSGDVLITVATGDLSDSEAERTGLVPTHAYAVLDMKKVNDIQLLQLKNPWSHLRWKGNFSELDRIHWTADLKTKLNYDPDNAMQFDNGIFWIDYDSICKFFDVFYLSWNPKMFEYTNCIHHSWRAGVGPVKDAFVIGDNPQFSLESTSNTGVIWILLTRHITQIEDFKENREYITVLVYKNNGRRVYYPNDPPPYIDGVRINSPHYLCKITLSPNSPSKYTLVVSQYEKMNTIYYTLRAYATSPFMMKKIENPYRYEKLVSDGKWEGNTAGGCLNHRDTYKYNPRYRIELEGCNENKLYIDLKGPREYQIGMDVSITKVNDEKITAPFTSKTTGAYRTGFVYLELDGIPAGTLDIVPSTFLPHQEGPFLLTIKSTCVFSVSRVG